MKLTLEPSAEMLVESYIKSRNPIVTVSMPYDDLTITQIIDCLIKPALLAYGFHADTVDKVFL